MPRAHRYFLPGHVWHITHRCHRREFLLKFARDRRRWRYWLYQARKRYGLCVLNYIVTSNHIHLLVQDKAEGAIARGMQLIAGRTAQEYNQRKGRKGAYWEDRYHATAVQGDDHLARCMVYIDLNMVRAGVVRHPAHWRDSGYGEIQSPPSRYGVIDREELTRLLGFGSETAMRRAHREWVQAALDQEQLTRQGCWTDCVAVGEEAYVAKVKRDLGVKAHHRPVANVDEGYVLREPGAVYGNGFRAENTDPAIK